MSELKTLVVDDTAYETRLTKKFVRRRPYVPKDPKRLAAFIPGLILEVRVASGERVRRGQSLLVLEAMKMQNDVTAPDPGTVMAVHVAAGQMVVKGQLLVEFE